MRWINAAAALPAKPMIFGFSSVTGVNSLIPFNGCVDLGNTDFKWLSFCGICQPAAAKSATALQEGTIHWLKHIVHTLELL